MQTVCDKECLYKAFLGFVKNTENKDNCNKLLKELKRVCEYLLPVYVNCPQGYEEDFLMEAVEKCWVVCNNLASRDCYKKVCPDSTKFRNFLFRCIENSFHDTWRKFNFSAFTDLDLPFVCSRILSPRSIVDFNLFMSEYKGIVLKFLKENNRYEELSDSVIEYFVEKFFAGDSREEIVNSLYNVFFVRNPYFFYQYLTVLCRIALKKLADSFKMEEIDIYIEPFLEYNEDEETE